MQPFQPTSVMFDIYFSGMFYLSQYTYKYVVNFSMVLFHGNTVFTLFCCHYLFSKSFHGHCVICYLFSQSFHLTFYLTTLSVTRTIAPNKQQIQKHVEESGNGLI